MNLNERSGENSVSKFWSEEVLLWLYFKNKEQKKANSVYNTKISYSFATAFELDTTYLLQGLLFVCTCPSSQEHNSPGRMARGASITASCELRSMENF